MLCKKCKADIPDDCLFCPWCGKKQQKTAVCRTRRAKGTGGVSKVEGPRRKAFKATWGSRFIGYYPTRAAALQAIESVPFSKPFLNSSTYFFTIFDDRSSPSMI